MGATENEIKLYSFEEVQKHKRDSGYRLGYWIVIHNKIYDVTAWLDDHPGGDEILMSYSGTDATEPWEDIGHSTEARERMKKYVIGELREEDRTVVVESSPNKLDSTDFHKEIPDDNRGSLINSDSIWNFNWMMAVSVLIIGFYIGHLTVDYYLNS